AASNTWLSPRAATSRSTPSAAIPSSHSRSIDREGMRDKSATATACAVLAALLLAAEPPAYAQTTEEKAAVCAACHGENGIPPGKTFPVIWGQHQGYLYLQLRDLKLGTRKNEAMAPFVAEMEREDMMALAEYFSKKPWPDLTQPLAPDGVAAVAARTN